MVSVSQSLLKVSLPLVPRANKPIATAELIKRLTDLSEQLIDASQDNAAIKGQLERTIAPQLVDKNLMQHKDKAVRSYVAVCIVEALRICAPDAPFNATQLKVRFIVNHGYAKARKYLSCSLNSSSILNQANKMRTILTPFTFSKFSNRLNASSSSTTWEIPPTA